MPTTEERVATLEDIARNHETQLRRQQQSIELLVQLAENSDRVQQQIVQTTGDLTTRFGHLEEATLSVVTAVGAL